MSFDVTYCTADCRNKECELHKYHAIESVLWKGYASYADRSKGCDDYKPKGEHKKHD